MNDTPRRSRFRLSLRALMVIVLLVGLVIGWKANRARNQRRAVEAIQAVHGNVSYDFQYQGNNVLSMPFKPGAEPPEPKWLRKIVGDEFFQEVTIANFRSAVPADVLANLATLDHLVFLNINGSKLDDQAFARMAEIPQLQALSVSQGSVTDAGLANLARARKLKRLTFHGASGVTDAGLAPLSTLPDLKSLTIMIAPRLTAAGLKKLGPVLSQLELLSLNQTGMTDEGMDCFDACRKLKTLSLGIPNVGDAGFAHFRNLESLEKLIISGSNVTDEGLSALGGLKNLKTLSLVGTRIAGPGLASLENLDQLETLTVVESKLTDEGLDSIRKMKGLKSVMIGGTHVTPEAIARLQAERPTLKINPAPIPPVRKPPSPTAPAAKK